MQPYVLVLNASYEILNVASMERAIRLLYKGKAEIIEAVPGREIVSPTVRLEMPSIIRLLYLIVRPHKEIPLSKQNVLLRDSFVCQYCGGRGNTVDHIVPKSRGGRDTWENCVCACTGCNQRKHHHSPEEAGMRLLRRPRRPTFVSWIFQRRGIADLRWERYFGVRESPASGWR